MCGARDAGGAKGEAGPYGTGGVMVAELQQATSATPQGLLGGGKRRERKGQRRGQGHGTRGGTESGTLVCLCMSGMEEIQARKQHALLLHPTQGDRHGLSVARAWSCGAVVLWCCGVGQGRAGPGPASSAFGLQRHRPASLPII